MNHEICLCPAHREFNKEIQELRMFSKEKLHKNSMDDLEVLSQEMFEYIEK